MKMKKILKNTLLSVGIFLAAAGLSILFQKLGVGEQITTIFVFAVFLISLLTEGYVYGIVSAFGGMLAVNYAFAYPYFAFDFNIPVNLISAIIMTAVSVLTGMLTTEIKRYEAEKAENVRELKPLPSFCRFCAIMTMSSCDVKILKVRFSESCALIQGEIYEFN